MDLIVYGHVAPPPTQPEIHIFIGPLVPLVKHELKAHPPSSLGMLRGQS